VSCEDEVWRTERALLPTLVLCITDSCTIGLICSSRSVSMVPEFGYMYVSCVGRLPLGVC